MTARRYFAGIGCRRDCSERTLRTLLEQALHANGLQIGDLAGIASIDVKRGDAGLHALAATLHLPLQFFSAQQLAAFAEQVSHSAFAERAVGSPSVAEASALAAAQKYGDNAELVIRKYKSSDATVAVALSLCPVNNTEEGPQ